ncbi:hypothetical protein D3C81_2109290 [compost metagenome]
MALNGVHAHLLAKLGYVAGLTVMEVAKLTIWQFDSKFKRPFPVRAYTQNLVIRFDVMLGNPVGFGLTPHQRTMV